jgi:curved DNA-binding protein CbpA
MQSYFSSCTTPEDVKKLYRTLAMQHHPDHGGDTATMQEINAQYKRALSSLHGTSSRGEDGKSRTYKYNADAEQQVIDQLDKTLRAKLDKVEIWLIGSWIWIKGDTYKHRRELTALSYVWNRKRQSWQWHRPEEEARRSRGSFEAIANKYGARQVSQPVTDEIN